MSSTSSEVTASSFCARRYGAGCSGEDLSIRSRSSATVYSLPSIVTRRGRRGQRSIQASTGVARANARWRRGVRRGTREAFCRAGADLGAPDWHFGSSMSDSHLKHGCRCRTDDHQPRRCARSHSRRAGPASRRGAKGRSPAWREQNAPGRGCSRSIDPRGLKVRSRTRRELHRPPPASIAFRRTRRIRSRGPNPQGGTRCTDALLASPWPWHFHSRFPQPRVRLRRQSRPGHSATSRRTSRQPSATATPTTGAPSRSTRTTACAGRSTASTP